MPIILAFQRLGYIVRHCLRGRQEREGEGEGEGERARGRSLDH